MTNTRPDRPDLQHAIQAFVDTGFAGIQLRVNDNHGEWVGSAGVRTLGDTAKPPTDADSGPAATLLAIR